MFGVFVLSTKVMNKTTWNFVNINSFYLEFSQKYMRIENCFSWRFLETVGQRLTKTKMRIHKKRRAATKDYSSQIQNLPPEVKLLEEIYFNYLQNS